MYIPFPLLNPPKCKTDIWYVCIYRYSRTETLPCMFPCREGGGGQKDNWENTKRISIVYSTYSKALVIFCLTRGGVFLLFFLFFFSHVRQVLEHYKDA